MSHLSKVIEKIKDQYSTYDNSSEIISDLESQINIVHWGDELSSDKFDFNYTLSKELLEVFINNYANSCKDFYEVASIIAKKNGLNDKELSKKLFTKALLKANLPNDYVKIAEKIIDDNGFDNPNMAQELYIKAIEFADNFDDYIDIAKSIFMFDKEWAKDIYQKAEYKILSLNEFNRFISILKDISDYEWAKKITLKAVKEFKHIEDKSDFGTTVEKIELIGYICEDRLLNDKVLAKEILDDTIHTITARYYTEVYNLIKNIIKDEDMAEEWANDHSDQIMDNIDEDITKKDIENLLENEDDIFSNEDDINSDLDSTMSNLEIDDDINDLISSDIKDENESDDDLKLDTSDSSSVIESIKMESTTDTDQQSDELMTDELLLDNTKEHFEDLVNDDSQDENLEQAQEYNEPTSEVDIENSLIEDDEKVTNDIHESITENTDDEQQQLIDNSDDVTIDENKDLNQLCEDQNNLSMLIMAIKDGKPITINCDNRDIVIDSSDLDIRGVIKEAFFNKWNNINESIKSSIQ